MRQTFATYKGCYLGIANHWKSPAELLQCPFLDDGLGIVDGLPALVSRTSQDLQSMR